MIKISGGDRDAGNYQPENRTRRDKFSGSFLTHSARMAFIVILFSTTLSFQAIDCSPQAESSLTPARKSSNTQVQVPQQSDAVRAETALIRLGIPLQRDPSGRVRWIKAAHGELNDNGMSYLSSLPLLEWLEIGGGSVTNAGMAHLKGCSALRRLYIHDVDLGNEELDWMSELRLEALSLQRTGITGKALKQLKAAETLTVLNLSENAIADVDMGEVARFKNLEVLALQDTGVTGAGLALLEGMKGLNVLNLINCEIVDEDMDYFVSMPNLRIVQAGGCTISSIAIEEITEKLPLLAIFR